MEPEKAIGSEEECRSCESGWTMYLVSPSHDHHDDHGHDGDAHHREDDSDGDSMASDASSGPVEATCRLSRTEEGLNCNYGLCLTKRTGKPVMKKTTTNTKEGKEERVLTETRVPTIAHDDDDDSSEVHSYVGSI
ncbi:PREDICTED: uncharacterized protein LOC104804610 [Tarenaya hassleriana]|uniref:uncharacterized protein LOC104804610 n=1 Tax=Tarenaya hassleriana TaxID=28532 RepID=UPI00053C3FC8|nr:PREDICTED: uncharacterized protein LOC104804610 [Tarenaya hassleriana]